MVVLFIALLDAILNLVNNNGWALQSKARTSKDNNLFLPFLRGSQARSEL